MSDALNELRAKYAAKAAEATAQDLNAPKVFHIFTKAPYVEPPEPTNAIDPEEIPEGTPDEGALKVVTGLVDDFETGNCRGIAAITWNQDEGCFETFVSLPAGLREADAAARMLGALKVLERALTDIAEGGTEVLTPIGSTAANALEKVDLDLDDDLEPVS